MEPNAEAANAAAAHDVRRPAVMLLNMVKKSETRVALGTFGAIARTGDVCPGTGARWRGDDDIC